MKLKNVDRNKVLIYLRERHPELNTRNDDFSLNQLGRTIEVRHFGIRWAFTGTYYNEVIEHIVSTTREENINKLLQRCDIDKMNIENNRDN